ncbi:PREDICTED: protein RUFY3 isoform X3 [Bactrocera latifrons]|uniref:protein RUFY3 isoform X3 n=1 Tax=Bactrocera latifrons TaxID=174628 RepID=UPI0008DDDC93|nr:PREDICTED: protein RUFY3 isoform X3 [Bactrocera latifrons]
MRSLADETRKLTLNNNNNNHSASTTIAIVTQSNSSNKIYKMQQQVNVMTSATMGVHQKQHQQQHQQQQKQLKQQQNNNSTTISLPKASHANTSEEIAGGVQDTIYLCNFRVSVDGDWLCLKELQDLDIGQQHSGGGGTSTSVYGVQRGTQLGQKNKRYSGMSNGLDDNGILTVRNLLGRRFNDAPEHVHKTNGSSSSSLSHLLTARHAHADNGLIGVFGVGGTGEWSNHPRDPAEIERSNLVNICKLVVKELLEQSLRFGRMLDSDHLPLQHFFIVIEHVLGHGLRPKKGLLGPRKELWDLLQSVENYCPEAQDITASVRDLPTVRTHIGRARAWLRIALMQKKLADYLQALIEHRDDSLYEYYEPHALMMSDEIVVIMGILVGLNVIDCNLCVKEEDLDSQQGVIDFSLYLRSSSRSNENDEETNQSLEANGQGNMIAVLDQKNYIEELNRHLNATVGNLQAKVESLTTTNALMKEDLAIARNSLLALQAENQALRQNATITNVPTSNAEASPNKSSDRANKAAIETLNAELSEEKKKNAELDKELKLQVSLKAESDVAMKLLEKDIHEKQDTIVSLRRQLDDIKQINLEMYRKLQECEDELTQKGEMVSRLQTKASQIGNILQSLERKYESKLEQQQQLTGQPIGDKSPSSRRQQNLQKFEALTKKHRQDIGPPVKRLHLKVDAIPPFNPNNYRKSPSATVAPDKLEAEGELKTPTSAKSFTEVAKSYPDKPMDTCKSDYALSQEKI